MSRPNLLACSDLDRTLIPNGPQSESPEARPILNKVIEHIAPLLCYVSGRDLTRILAAIDEYQLPYPHYIIADVGTSIYEFEQEQWRSLASWEAYLNHDWGGMDRVELASQLSDVGAAQAPLKLQAEDKQGPFKLSYEVTPSAWLEQSVPVFEAALNQIVDTLAKQGGEFNFQLTASVDETKDEGLLDVLPAAAGKLGAIRFLAAQLQFQDRDIYFCGDSGNDRDVLLSEFNACLVANATPVFREALERERGSMPSPDTLYFANGQLSEKLNGCYSAGFIEGLLYYYPKFKEILPERLL